MIKKLIKKLIFGLPFVASSQNSIPLKYTLKPSLFAKPVVSLVACILILLTSRNVAPSQIQEIEKTNQRNDSKSTQQSLIDLRSAKDLNYMRKLVQQAGEPENWVSSFNELKALGPLAKEALRERVNDSNPNRADLYRSLLYDLIAAEFSQRCKEFRQNDIWWKNNTFPGIDHFLSLGDRSAESKALFMSIVDSHPELFIWLDVSPEEFVDKVQELAFRLLSRRYIRGVIRPAPLGSIRNDQLTLFFFLSHPAMINYLKSMPIQLEQLINNYLVQSIQFKGNTGHPDFVRKCLVRIINQLNPNAQSYMLYNTVKNTKMREVCPWLLKIALKKTMDPDDRLGAIDLVGEMGNRSMIPSLEKLLDDPNLYRINLNLNLNRNLQSKLFEIRLRDQALISLIKIAKIPKKLVGIKNEPSLKVYYFSPSGDFFKDKQSKIFALKKYLAWRKRQKDLPPMATNFKLLAKEK